MTSRHSIFQGQCAHHDCGPTRPLLSFLALGCLTLVLSTGCDTDPTGSSSPEERSAPWCRDLCQSEMDHRDAAAQRAYDAAMAGCGSNVACQDMARNDLNTALRRSRSDFSNCTGKC